jgi:hypothetical protein
MLAPLMAQDQEIYPEQQGWSQSQMRKWYELSQGSRLIPMPWLEALSNKDGSKFFTRKTLENFGYIYFSDKPNELPIGFIIDQLGADAWMGLNCAACHTAKLKFGNASMFIHGGQSMADLQGFTTRLIDNVLRIANSTPQFEIFAIQVLGSAATEDQKSKLKNDILAWLDFRKRINDTGSDSHWGRGRADAVGIILATTAAVVADPKVAIEDREPFPASNAPVSFPFIWNANQQARLQHNGVVDNGTDFGIVKVAKIGALIRNWTEALGVFADVKLDTKAQKIDSSIRLDNIMLMEQSLADLQSPRWPAAFGILNTEKQNRGAVLFKSNCASCHGELSATNTTSQLPLIDTPSKMRAFDPQGFVFLQPLFGKNTKPKDFKKSLQPSSEFIGTDPSMACNALMHRVPTGRLEGQKNVKDIKPSKTDENFADHAVTTDILRVLIQRDVLAHRTSFLIAFADNQIAAAGEQLAQYVYAETGIDYRGQSASDDPLAPLRAELQNCVDYLQIARGFYPKMPLPVYKSRPLNGIWATAPYLHNGSVPTLFDLLQPQSKRPKTFGYFDGEMDVEKGGLKNTAANPQSFIFQTYDNEGTVILGNWNGGHEYGTKLSQQEKYDLVEYLKGL